MKLEDVLKKNNRAHILSETDGGLFVCMCATSVYSDTLNFYACHIEKIKYILGYPSCITKELLFSDEWKEGEYNNGQ